MKKKMNPKLTFASHSSGLTLWRVSHKYWEFEVYWDGGTIVVVGPQLGSDLSCTMGFPDVRTCSSFPFWPLLVIVIGLLKTWEFPKGYLTASWLWWCLPQRVRLCCAPKKFHMICINEGGTIILGTFIFCVALRLKTYSLYYRAYCSA